MSARPHHRSSTHAAARPRSTVSAPSSYFTAFTSSPSAAKTRGVFTTNTSAYKRAPRRNFIVRMYEKAMKLIRDFLRYAKKNPLKVIVPLVVALVGGGAIAGLVKRMGGLQGLGLDKLGFGALKGMNVDQWIGVGHGVRRGAEGFPGSGSEGGGVDGMAMAKGAIKVVSAFL